MNEKPSTATAVWIATAVLHMENPTRNSFQASEIAEKSQNLDLVRARSATLSMHISLHCVANSKAAPNTIRFLYRVKNGWYRLFRNGDDFHESRKYGRTFPKRESLPEEYVELLNWYEKPDFSGLSLETEVYGTYSYDSCCTNCTIRSHFNIPRKTLAEDFLKGEECFACGCTTLM
mgnify:CR=1 FL=1